MMTIGGWILFIIIALALLVGGFGLSFNLYRESKENHVIYDKKDKKYKIGSVVSSVASVALTVAVFFALHWYYNDTESGARAMKDQESNLGDGLTRVVEIYDMEGELIKKYSGQFDIEMHNTHIVFDDENGKRHTIYFTTGTVAIDEQ